MYNYSIYKKWHKDGTSYYALVRESLPGRIEEWPTILYTNSTVALVQNFLAEIKDGRRDIDGQYEDVLISREEF